MDLQISLAEQIIVQHMKKYSFLLVNGDPSGDRPLFFQPTKVYHMKVTEAVDASAAAIRKLLLHGLLEPYNHESSVSDAHVFCLSEAGRESD